MHEGRALSAIVNCHAEGRWWLTLNSFPSDAEGMPGAALCAYAFTGDQMEMPGVPTCAADHCCGCRWRHQHRHQHRQMWCKMINMIFTVGLCCCWEPASPSISMPACGGGVEGAYRLVIPGVRTWLGGGGGGLDARLLGWN